MTSRARPLAIGIVGFGKIARAEHVAAIGGSGRFVLSGVVDPAEVESPVQRYVELEPMLVGEHAPAVVAICTPPQSRFTLARDALARGKHVLLEKPPGVTVSEVELLRGLAAAAGSTLFCAWHSRFAPGVDPARAWLATRTPRRVRIEWREDVRVWHPDQRWIWAPGGFGVFDPGINALSIATAVLPQPLVLTNATLHVPADCATPIAAELELTDASDVDMTASFDWRQSGPPTWDIDVETDAGHLRLTDGGDRLIIDGREMALGASAEYVSVYRHFARLIDARRSDVDLAPLRLVADAFMRGRREPCAPFNCLSI